MPKVSVIVLTYNRAKLLKECLQSALAQSFSDFEIIVADDASSDGTVGVVKELAGKDKRIIYYRQQKNIGRLALRPLIMRKIQGTYIAVLDDDDIWSDREKLRKQSEFLDANFDYVLCGTAATLIDQDGKELYEAQNPETDAEIRQSILSRNPFFASSVLFRKEVYEKSGGYNQTLIASEDYDLWLKLGVLGKLYNFTDRSIKYRLQVHNPYRIMSSKAAFYLIKKYRRNYPNYWKSFLLLWLRFIYTSLPRPDFLEKIVLKLRYTKKFKI